MTTNVNGLFEFGTLINGLSAGSSAGMSGMSGPWTVFACLT